MIVPLLWVPDNLSFYCGLEPDLPRDSGPKAATGCATGFKRAWCCAMLAQTAPICPLSPLDPLPRISDHVQGCGGQIRTLVEDFQVEELPAYLPSGEGDHLYLWVEKRDMAGETMRRVIARSVGAQNGDIGMAGLKDRRAVTRQWVSIPRKFADRIAAIEGDRLKVLQAVPHRNKLRTGHLDGNRFVIRIRGAVSDGAARIAAKLVALRQSGVPNFYGAQRMGHGGETLAAGWALSQGMTGLVCVELPDGTAHTIDLTDRVLRRLAASALQSEVFNRTLAARMAGGLFQTVLDGDLCRKTDTGGTFPTDDCAREQARFDDGQLELTGPMWGPKMMRPERTAAEFEASVLASMGLTPENFVALGHLAEGTRRPVRSVPTAISVSEDDGLVVRFELPSGAFATGVIHELVGPVAAAAADINPDFAAGSPASAVPCA